MVGQRRCRSLTHPTKDAMFFTRAELNKCDTRILVARKTQEFRSLLAKIRIGDDSMNRSGWFIVCFLLIVPNYLSAQQPKENKGNRYALLVAVNNYPDLGEEWTLDGPLNDIALFGELLTNDFAFPKSAVRKLSAESGKDNEPTLANIRRELDVLAKPGFLKKDDYVVIFMAGHGSQQLARETDNVELDGYDEVFLPMDASFDEDNLTWKNGLVDDELRDWLEKIGKTGARVWLVVDACHSGTIERSSGNMKAREVPVEALLKNPGAQKKWADKKAVGNPNVRGTGTDRLAFEFGDHLKNVVAIYACAADEQEFEMPHAEDDSGKTYGLMAYTLCSVLKSAAAKKLSYRELVDRIDNSYEAEYFSKPNPSVSGTLADDVVLGYEKGPPTLPTIRLSKERQRFLVNAGLLHGITRGSVLSLHPLKEEQKILGYVRVDKSNLAKAYVKSTKYEHTPALKQLPKQAICKLVELDMGEFRLPVAFADKTRNEKHIPIAVQTSWKVKLQGISKEKEAPIRLVAENSPGVWLIQMADLKSRKTLLIPPGTALGNKSSASFPLSDGDASEQVLSSKLKDYTKVANLLRLAGILKWNESSRFVPQARPLKVQFRILRESGKEPLSQGELSEVLDGEKIRLQILNKSNSPVDFTLIHINDALRMTAINLADNRLPANQKNPREFVPTIRASAPGIDRWMVIAVKASGAPMNFNYLAERVRGDARRTIRNSSRSPSAKIMDTLLLNAAYPNKTREFIRFELNPTSNCVIRVAEYLSRQKS